ncbi:diguanylate cyclase/phosphodiesterase (GGDEF & EAL domains) with PAS/PAC sensor(s) [hydrothermal vent metagenome]|uniref:Diguanylate cyclase DosC n=1 Tax=hydrothermal vent metagenome TaxID=652676 RepID=A0A3B0YDF5_9ZZZZ
MSNTKNNVEDSSLSEKIRYRKKFLEFTSVDVKRLKEVNKLLETTEDSLIDEFYNYLLSFKDTRSLIRDEKMLSKLKIVQKAYFNSLTSGHYEEEYVTQRQRIGISHQKVGISIQWYLGAYVKYIRLVISKLQNSKSFGLSHKVEIEASLLKIIFFDIGITIDTYLETREKVARQLTARLSELNQIAVDLTSSMDVDKLLNNLMEGGRRLTDSFAASIVHFDSDKNKFTGWKTSGLSDNFVKNMKFRTGGLAEKVFSSGCYILSNDQPESDCKLSALARDEGVKGFLCLPLTSRTRRLGLIYFYLNDRETFDPGEVESLVTLAHLASGAINNARLYAETLTLSITDPLTGLANRRAGETHLELERIRVAKKKSFSSLLMIDIDFFKKINDSYGHPTGDSVLKQLANIFIAQIRGIDIASRFGGEEFSILLPDTLNDAAEAVANRLLKVIRETPIVIPDNEDINITVSIGLVTFNSSSSHDIKTLISQADGALYESKRQGRNRVCVYNTYAGCQGERSEGG